MKKQNIKLYHSAYNIFRLMLFPKSDCKININSYLTFSSLKSQTKYKPPK